MKELLTNSDRVALRDYIENYISSVDSYSPFSLGMLIVTFYKRAIKVFDDKEKALFYSACIPEVFLVVSSENKEVRQKLLESDIDADTLWTWVDKWDDINKVADSAKLKEYISYILRSEFYIRKNKIISKINLILGSLKGYDDKNSELRSVWQQINLLILDHRDSNGVPIGTDFSEPQILRVKKLQNEIIEINSRFSNVLGLTQGELEEIDFLCEKIEIPDFYNSDYYNRLTELSGKHFLLGLSSKQIESYKKLVESLNHLQSYVATDYYIDIVNKYFIRANLKPISKMTAELILDPEYIQDTLNDNLDFKEWFENNHILKKYWDWQVGYSGGMISKYERLCIWSQILPYIVNFAEEFFIISNNPNATLNKEFTSKYESNPVIPLNYREEKIREDYENYFREIKCDSWTIHDIISIFKNEYQGIEFEDSYKIMLWEKGVFG